VHLQLVLPRPGKMIDKVVAQHLPRQTALPLERGRRALERRGQLDQCLAGHAGRVDRAIREGCLVLDPAEAESEDGGKGEEGVHLDKSIKRVSRMGDEECGGGEELDVLIAVAVRGGNDGNLGVTSGQGARITHVSTWHSDLEAGGGSIDSWGRDDPDRGRA